MTTHPINPYQPAAAVSEKNSDSITEIQFRLTTRLLRYGESKYLIHAYSRRLMLGSLLSIFLSTLIFVVAVYSGTVSFLTAFVGTMIATTAIYLALVRSAKITIRENLKRHGMSDGAACSVTMQAGTVVIHTPTGVYRWVAEKLKTYRTQKGQLLLPREPIFLIIPKVNESTRAEYKELIKAIKSQAR